MLARHGIACDPALTAPGYFRTNSAKLAMEEILARGVAIDGVVAANDEMATGAVDVLRKQGRRVPQDIPVTGFDDLMLARLGNPPLTTVAQPFEQVADWAVRAIEEQKAGRDGAGVHARSPRGSSAVNLAGAATKRTDGIRRPMPAAHSTGRSGPSPTRLGTLWPVLAGLLLAPASRAAPRRRRACSMGCARRSAGSARRSTAAIVGLLDNAGTDNERQRMLHSAICYLRDELRGWSNLQVERVLFDGLNLVALSNTTSQMQHRLLLDENYLRLLGVGEQASIAFDLASLRDALVKGLPNAGVRTAYLACVAGAGEGRAAIRDVPARRRAGGERERGVSRQPVAPAGRADGRPARETFWSSRWRSRTSCWASSRSTTPTGSTPTRRSATRSRPRSRASACARSWCRRACCTNAACRNELAATKRMEALSVLAGGVAHDLNNALGPLVALPDVILAQLGEMQGNEESVRDLRTDVEAIKVASLRAAQTIKDLLTLGRQGRMAKENLDINRVIKSCWANNSLRFVEESKVGAINASR